MDRLSIGVLASGRGSNFQAIIDSIASGYLKAGIALLASLMIFVFYNDIMRIFGE